MPRLTFQSIAVEDGRVINVVLQPDITRFILDQRDQDGGGNENTPNESRDVERGLRDAEAIGLGRVLTAYRREARTAGVEVVLEVAALALRIGADERNPIGRFRNLDLPAPNQEPPAAHPVEHDAPPFEGGAPENATRMVHAPTNGSKRAS